MLTNFALLTNEQKTAWSMDMWKHARNYSFVKPLIALRSRSGASAGRFLRRPISAELSGLLPNVAGSIDEKVGGSNCPPKMLRLRRLQTSTASNSGLSRRCCAAATTIAARWGEGVHGRELGVIENRPVRAATEPGVVDRVVHRGRVNHERLDGVGFLHLRANDPPLVARRRLVRQVHEPLQVVHQVV